MEHSPLVLKSNEKLVALAFGACIGDDEDGVTKIYTARTGDRIILDVR